MLNRNETAMKTKAIQFILIFSLAVSAHAQTKNDIFSSNTPVTWLGLDFTQVRFVGDRDVWADTGRTLETLESLNNLMIKESEKYDIARAIDKARVENETRITIIHNGKLDLHDRITDTMTEHFLKASDIQGIVSKYDFKGLQGIGLMFNVESFNKPSEQAIVWVTFINMDTKEVLITEKMMQAPMGFGIRNYWAGAIYKIIKDINKSDYERWRKKYYRKNS